MAGPALPQRIWRRARCAEITQKYGIRAETAFPSENPWFLQEKNMIFRQGGSAPWTPAKKRSFSFLIN